MALIKASDIVEQSITFTTANGHGTNADNKVRKWTTKTGTPNSMTFTSDSGDGDYITINTSENYSVLYIDGYNGGSGYFGISRNAAPADLISNITNPWALDNPGTKFLAGYQAGISTGSNGATCSWSGFLNAGDVIRCQDNGDCNLTGRAFFKITKL
jgi:hypothetical protein